MSLKKLQLSSTLFPKNGIYITKNDKKMGLIHRVIFQFRSDIKENGGIEYNKNQLEALIRLKIAKWRRQRIAFNENLFRPFSLPLRGTRVHGCKCKFDPREREEDRGMLGGVKLACVGTRTDLVYLYTRARTHARTMDTSPLSN